VEEGITVAAADMGGGTVVAIGEDRFELASRRGGDAASVLLGERITCGCGGGGIISG
jgi:hypothetical protein